jgi:hypothetical protein
VAVASSSSSRSPEAWRVSEPVLVVGLQQMGSSSPSLLEVAEESSSSRTSCTSLRQRKWQGTLHTCARSLGCGGVLYVPRQGNLTMLLQSQKLLAANN